MQKYLMVIAKYNDWRQDFYNQYISPRNKEYCDKWNFKYIEIDNNIELPLFRGNPTWWKFSILREYIKNEILSDGDIFTHLDADMIIHDMSKEYITAKSFSYAIDSGNTHCMGSYSIKINDWSKKLIDLILDENRYNTIGSKITKHEAFGYMSSFWIEFREQASWYSLAGIKRHSWKPFWEFDNYGWHSEYNEDVIYSIDELHENVEILDTAWNVTEMIGESDCNFLINKIDKKDVIIRHFAGGQKWREEYLNDKK